MLYSAPKTPVNICDEAFAVGKSVLVFLCGPYICKVVGRSKHSRIAAGNFTEPIAIEELEERDFKVWPEHDLRELGAEIALAIRGL